MTKTNQKPKIAFAFVTKGRASGFGALTRCEAMIKALKRAKLLPNQVELEVFGVAERAGIPEYLENVRAYTMRPDSKIIEMPTEHFSEKLFEYLSYEMCREIEKYGADLLLIDAYPFFVADATWPGNERRPKNVWLIAKNSPGAINFRPYQHFDRAYFTEPVDNGHWSDSYCVEKCRSLAEVEKGIRDKYYLEPFDVDNQARWYERNGKRSRKLIPPLLTIEPGQILSREDARAGLFEHFGVEPNDKPIILITSTFGGITDQEINEYRAWMRYQLTEWGLYENKENYNLLWLGGAAPKPVQPLPNIYRYLAGADYIITNAAYSTFYEVRYMAQSGRFTGKAAFYSLHMIHPDHKWRAEMQEKLLRAPNAFGPGHGADSDGNTDIWNGADYLAEAIKQKFRLG